MILGVKIMIYILKKAFLAIATLTIISSLAFISLASHALPSIGEIAENSVIVGEELALSAPVIKEEADDTVYELEWSIAEENAVEGAVIADNKVTATSSGELIITATIIDSDPAISRNFTITVNEMVVFAEIEEDLEDSEIDFKLPAGLPLNTRAKLDVESLELADDNEPFNLTNVLSISEGTLRLLGDNLLYADTVVGSAVTARLYINPTLATLNTPISLMINDSMEYSTNMKVYNIFQKYFSNNIKVSSFMHEGEFGMFVNVALLLDDENHNPTHYYLYNINTNKYKEISDYYIDDNNYLRFTTNEGGTIIASEGELLSRVAE